MFHVFEVERGEVAALWRCSAPDFASAKQEAVDWYNREIGTADGENLNAAREGTMFADFEELADWLQGNGFSIHIAKIED